MYEYEIERRNDGVDHIRIDSQGRTLLGRLLANEARTPFTLSMAQPLETYFASLEAYWAWLRSGRCHGEFRQLYGPTAKRATEHSLRVECPNFRSLVSQALLAKIQQTPRLAIMLSTNDLPLVRYSFAPDGSLFTIETQPWFMTRLQQIAKEIACQSKSKTARRKATTVP